MAYRARDVVDYRGEATDVEAIGFPVEAYCLQD